MRCRTIALNVPSVCLSVCHAAANIAEQVEVLFMVETVEDPANMRQRSQFSHGFDGASATLCWLPVCQRADSIEYCMYVSH